MDKQTKLLENLINQPSWLIRDAMKLVRLGGNARIKNKNGEPLLHIISRRNKDKKYDAVMIELIDKYHVDINTRYLGKTILEHLMSREKWHISEAMNYVRLGVDPNGKNPQGEPLLHILSRYNENGSQDAHIHELIYKYKVDINTLYSGKTILERLLDSPSWAVDQAMKLVRIGANVDTKNSRGESLLELISKHNKKGCFDNELRELLLLSGSQKKQEKNNSKNQPRRSVPRSSSTSLIISNVSKQNLTPPPDSQLKNLNEKIIMQQDEIKRLNNDLFLLKEENEVLWKNLGAMAKNNNEVTPPSYEDDYKNEFKLH